LTPPPPIPEFVYVFDSGWAGVAQIIAISEATNGKVAAIIHIKNNFAGFPKDELEDMMRGMPGGSHLELETTVKGVDLIAVAYNFSTKKTLYMIATKGAGATIDGEPYYSKYVDHLRNVHVRPVRRPALLSRYFLKFLKVDTHDMRLL
jgi:hypothetical protein